MARYPAKSRAQPVAEAMLSRVSPLRDVALQGRFGAAAGLPGVEFRVRHPLSIVTVIARMGQGEAVSSALGKYNAQWAGPDQYFVVAEGRGEGALYRELKAALAGAASVTDQSHGRVIIRVSGPRARNLLAKGSAVDLYPDEFAIGQSAVTQMAHIGVHLTRVEEDAYDLSVFRGFAESFWEWITGQAEEFGYEMK